MGMTRSSMLGRTNFFCRKGRNENGAWDQRTCSKGNETTRYVLQCCVHEAYSYCYCEANTQRGHLMRPAHIYYNQLERSILREECQGQRSYILPEESGEWNSCPVGSRMAADRAEFSKCYIPIWGGMWSMELYLCVTQCNRICMCNIQSAAVNTCTSYQRLFWQHMTN